MNKIRQFFAGKLSSLVLLIIFLFYSIPFITKTSEVLAGDRTCVCAFDGFGYYMYLPRLFQEGDLYFTHDWAQGIQNEYCNGVYAHQVEQGKYDNPLNIYQMGLAIVELPAYALADTIARISGFERNGFSTPYHVLFIANALIFIFLGLLYLKRLLRLFFSDAHSAISLLILYAASNTYITFTEQYDLAHLYLFTLNSIWLYHFFKFTQLQQKKNLIAAAVFFGLTVCIRPTQAIWGIIPFLYLFRELKFSRLFWKYIIHFPLAALIWNIPQIVYWKVVGGSFIILNIHTEDIVLSDPHILDFLFSYRKGWILYSPVFLLIVPGLYYLFKNKNKLFWPIATFLATHIYIMSAWESWWFASSFGSRAMVETYPIIAILLAQLVYSLRAFITKLVVAFFLLAVSVLNIIQSAQVKTFHLSTYRMSKQHYWYIFGKLNINNYTNDRLEIDRSDKNWPEHYREKGVPDGMEVMHKTIYRQKGELEAVIGSNLGIVHLELLKLVPSDETLLEVTFKTKTSDSSKSSVLKFETVSPYNCYSWDSFEISQSFKQGEFVAHKYRFNLPYIRHKGDYMQIYINNEFGGNVVLKDLKIEAFTLKRE